MSEKGERGRACVAAHGLHGQPPGAAVA